MVCGAYVPTEGKILLDGQEIQGLKAHEVARRGIARTFQITRVFKDMTVEDNLIGGFCAAPGAFPVFQPGPQPHPAKFGRKCMEYLDAGRSGANFAKAKAGDLSLGYMRRLEIARALALQPILLMLDEPCAGLSKDATRDFMKLVRKLRSDQVRPS